MNFTSAKLKMFNFVIDLKKKTSPDRFLHLLDVFCAGF